MKNVKFTSLLAVSLFLLGIGMQAQTVTPSKKYVTKEVKGINGFTAMEVLGSPDVEYRQSKNGKTQVVIDGSENLVDLLEVTAGNGVLKVNFKKGVNIRGGEYRLKVIASSPALSRVEVKGSGDVVLKGIVQGTDLQLNLIGSGDIEGEDLRYTHISASVRGSGDIDLKRLKAINVDAEVKGSGDIDMKGSAQQALLTVRGSGDITATHLKVANVVATVDGSGDIVCYASKQLDANVRGSGDIGYKGNPSVVNKQGKKNQITGR